MANDKSTYAANQSLNALLGAGAHVSLHSADPGNNGASEIAGGSYARKAAAFDAAAGGATQNSDALEWPDMPAVTVAYAGIWDAASTGNFLYRVNLASSKTYEAGDTATFAVGDIDVSET